MAIKSRNKRNKPNKRNKRKTQKREVGGTINNISNNDNDADNDGTTVGSDDGDDDGTTVGSDDGDDDNVNNVNINLVTYHDSNKIKSVDVRKNDTDQLLYMEFVEFPENEEEYIISFETKNGTYEYNVTNNKLYITLNEHLDYLINLNNYINKKRQKIDDKLFNERFEYLLYYFDSFLVMKDGDINIKKYTVENILILDDFIGNCISILIKIANSEATDSIKIYMNEYISKINIFKTIIDVYYKFISELKDKNDGLFERIKSFYDNTLEKYVITQFGKKHFNFNYSGNMISEIKKASSLLFSEELQKDNTDQSKKLIEYHNNSFGIYGDNLTEKRNNSKSRLEIRKPDSKENKNKQSTEVEEVEEVEVITEKEKEKEKEKHQNNLVFKELLNDLINELDKVKDKLKKGSINYNNNNNESNTINTINNGRQTLQKDDNKKSTNEPLYKRKIRNIKDIHGDLNRQKIFGNVLTPRNPYFSNELNKKQLRSTTSPPTRRSTTAPPTRRSTTAPPTRRSTTAPPTRRSTTAPPTRRSTRRSTTAPYKKKP